MHRNTYLLVSLLAVFAALVVGINLGRKFSAPIPATTTTPQPTLQPTPSTILIPYTNNVCGFSVEYPDTLTLLDSASGSAVLTDRTNAGDAIAITCQKDIPRSPLPQELIEPVGVWNSDHTASIAAKLYHDASAKDGTPMDVLIFRHPKTGLDVFLAGYGPVFNQILSTLFLLP